MARTAAERWSTFKKRHTQLHIPDAGYCYGTADGYVACVVRMSKSSAQRGARLLANAGHTRVDLVKVENRGHDRHVIAEIFPKRHSADRRFKAYR